MNWFKKVFRIKTKNDRILDLEATICSLNSRTVELEKAILLINVHNIAATSACKSLYESSITSAKSFNELSKVVRAILENNENIKITKEHETAK